ncbi:hypothetical protein [Desulfocurvibacter africanus]|uniref:hypothetical protein n=1 Tax=Desulfocurvibacter africanus TaxID=873 RepID=UPI000484E826|nr:hypothetical protein [Desulfocurvibacter africanus]
MPVTTILQSRRKQEAQKRLDFYNDKHREHLLGLLAQRFQEPERFQPVFVNVLKKVINNLALVYLEPPKREVLNGSEQDKAIFSEMAESCGLSLKLKIAARQVKLLKTVMLRPVWRQGRMELDLLQPHVLDVETGDTPEELKAVIVTHFPESGRDEDTVFKRWTAESVTTLDARGHTIGQEPNPYGVLPFVPLWDGIPAGDFWLEGGDDLIALQEAINTKLTDLLFIIEKQGFGVGYLKGGEGSELNPVYQVGPGSLVSLPENGELGFAAPNAPILDILKSIDFLIKQAAITNGLPASSLSTEAREESGISRLIENRELQEKRSDDIELFRTYEKRLFEVMRVVWNAHNAGRQLSEKAQLSVDFYDLKPKASQGEQIAAWESLLSMGIKDEADIVQEMNPDIKTREEAEAYLLQRQTFRAKLKSPAMANNEPDFLTE